MHKIKAFCVHFLLMFVSCLWTMSMQAQTMPDALPGTAKIDHGSLSAVAMTAPSDSVISHEEPELELTVENLLAVLDKYGVKHKEIVASQAILETGKFTSKVCKTKHNLFGLRHPSDGSYYTFDRWEESVKAYRDDVQYKYSSGDYYAFLKRIGYAGDRRYISKVRTIAKKYFEDPVREEIDNDLADNDGPAAAT